MTPTEIASLITSVATAIAIVVAAIGAFSALREYELKLKAEARLAESTKAETDIRLLQLFTELLYSASGRRGDAVYSKEIVDLLIQKDILTEDELKDPNEVRAKFSIAALLAQAPGGASSDASFASIATLADYDVIYDSAIEALESFKRANYRPAHCDTYLNIIRSRREIREKQSKK